VKERTMATAEADSDISDIEVVRAFELYEQQHKAGVSSPEVPGETLLRKGGRLGLDCNAACDRAIERGLVRWHVVDEADRGPTEKGRALLDAAGAEKDSQQ
jgi:hypothetical protein